MINVIINGSAGKMGKIVASLIKEEKDMQVVAGIDPNIYDDPDFPIFPSIQECDVKADVIIDFSVSYVVPFLLDYSVKNNIPLVLCTTGLSEEVIKKVKESSEKVAILKSANMSVGVNLLMKLLKTAAKDLYDSGFDIEIVEKHHNQKLDAPSGTALALADSINEEFNNEYEYIYDRSQRRDKRSPKEIGISAIRGGTIVGEHDVIFAGKDEIITFSHTALSKSIFAVGAIKAAKFLAGKGPGLYTMKEVLE